MTAWQPDERWLDARFLTKVVPDLFADAAPRRLPVAVLLGGQPGSGKSRAAQFAREMHADDLVDVIGDDFRSLHPDFKRLQRDSPLTMAQVTQCVSGPLVERSIHFAIQRRFSVLVEGTFRDPAIACSTAAGFRDAGFYVHAIALAVPPAVSRASTIGRYWETQGTAHSRWTPPDAHDAALRGMPLTVAALARSHAVNRFSVIDRTGSLLEDSSRPGTSRAAQMVACIRDTHERPLTLAERRLVLATTRRAQAAAHGNAGSDTTRP